jgi:quinol-cytochrome oxidoreductase complex cytochrome b subunit
MEPETIPPITPEEARASLAEIDRIALLTRQMIARGGSAPIVILWGVIWMIGYATMQFFPEAPRWFWLILDVVGIAGSIRFGRWSRKSPVKFANGGRIGISWLILFAFAVIWLTILGPWDPNAHRLANYAPDLDRKIAAYWATVPMFAYVLMGLWLDRFFVWLGALVTLATLGGYFFLANYFFLWMAVIGGGSLVVSGLFIRKNWR